MGLAEQLIATIQKHPCLWDIRDEDHHNRCAKDIAWDEVLKDLYSKWDSFTETQKESTRLDIRKKWSNIRDSYRKDKFRTSYAHKKSKNVTKKYIYSDILSFLDQSFKIRRRGCKKNIKEENDDEEGDDDVNEEEEDAEEGEGGGEEEEEELEDGMKKNTKKQEGTEQKRTQVIVENCNIPVVPEIIRKKRRKISIENDNNDDDIKFLMSLRSDMRALPQAQKLEFKIGVLQLVQKLNAESGGYSNYYYMASRSPSCNSPSSFYPNDNIVCVPNTSPTNGGTNESEYVNERSILSLTFNGATDQKRNSKRIVD